MMKAFLRCLTLVAALCVAWATNAQSLADYTYTTGTDATKWITLNAYTDVTADATGGDSWASSVMNIGFSFPFGEESYTQYSVNSDGNLRLGSTVTEMTNYSTPFSTSNSNTNNPKINFLGCDGYLVTGTHYVHSQMIGPDMFVVEFCMGTYNSTTRNNSYKWQVHLFSNGNIEVVMGEAPAAAPNAANQKGLCASAEDGWIIGSDNVATHFTNGSSTTWATGNWPTAYTHYTFTRPLYTCPRPSAVTATAQSPNSGFISWTPGDASQNNFVVAYGTGTDPEAMATASSTSNYIALVGLTSLTTYNVFVKAVCSDNDQSNWSRMASFTTLYDCGAGYALKTAAIGNGTSASSSYAFYSSTTYPIGSTTAIFTAEEIADAQLFENSTLNNIRLHVGSTGGTINDVHIYAKNVNKSAFDATGDTIPVTEMTEVFSGDITAVVQEWINLPLTTPFAYNQDSNLMLTFRRNGAASAAVSFYYTSTSPNYLNIYGYRTATGSTISATRTYSRPNVELQFCSEIPDCLPIYEIAYNTVTNSSATITWTPTDTSVHNYEVAYGTVNDIAQMTIINATSPSTVLPNLSANTTYYVRVRALCSATSESSWSRTIEFHTECTVADSAIFFENFDNYTGNDIPDCWHQGWYYQNTTSGVKTQPFLTSTTQKYGSTGRSMSLQDQGTGTLSYLSTACLPIDRAGKYTVSLQVYRSTYSTFKPNEGIKIWLSPSSSDTIGATLLGYIHREYTLEPAVSATGWYQYEYEIPQVGNQYILIEGVSEYGAATYFDNLEVKLTPCLKNVPYSIDFESSETNMIPLCWDNSASTSSTLNNNPHYIYGVYSYSGNKMLRMYNYLVQSGFTAINTNSFIIPTTDSYELLVDVSNRANCGNLDLCISPDGGHNYTLIGSINNQTGTFNQTIPGTFTTYTYDLSSYAGDTVFFRFSTSANYGNGAIYIDNFRIRKINNCATPDDVEATATGYNSALVTWTPADSTQNTFVVAYGTGSNPDEMDTIMVTGTTAAINNLTAETNYNFYVKAICDATSESYWSTVSSIFTGYCAPAPTSVDNNGITNVTFGTGDEIVNNNQRPTASPYYGNYSTQVGAVAAGDIANVAITYATNYTYGTIIWVDWDNSLTFDGNEVVFAGESPSANPTIFNASFTIPSTQAAGNYRMRIAGADSYYDSYIGSIADAANADPCPTSSYTIVHDYTLHVLPMPSCRTPRNVMASNITNSSADISWTLADTTQNNFVVAYGTETNPDLMTTITSATNNVTLTGLYNGTTYNVFVKAVCSAEDESDWSNMVTFTTAFCNEENSCLITVNMADEYGDGWNGDAALNVVDALTGITVATFKIMEDDNAYSATDSAYVCRGRLYNLVWQTGTYDDENSFTIISSTGDTIYSSSDLDNLDSALLASFVPACPIVDSSVTVTVATANILMGSTIPAPGEYTLTIGDTVSVMAVANAGFRFVNWALSGDGMRGITIFGNPYETVIPEDFAGMNYTLTANFGIELDTITVLSDNETMGTVAGSGIYENGTFITITATPASNCHFLQWNDGDTHAVRTIIVNSNATYIATFAYNTTNVTIIPNNAAMGTTDSMPGTYVYNAGDTIRALAIPYTGHSFDYWTIDHGTFIDTLVANPVEVILPAYLSGLNITMTAWFETNEYTLTAAPNNNLMGTVTGGGVYEYGDTVTLSATPAANCYFVRWSDSDTNATRDVVVLGDASYVAVFAYYPVSLTVAVNDATMGTTTPAPGTYTYQVGDLITFSNTANWGYRFVNWTVAVDGVDSVFTFTDNTLGLTIPALISGMSATITANFEVLPYHTVTLNVKDTYGNPNIGGSVMGAGNYLEGEEVTIMATADQNFVFAGWIDGTGATVYPDAISTFLMGTENVELTAVFNLSDAIVDVTVNDPTMGYVLVNGENTNQYWGHVYDNVEVIAIANPGYHFVEWDIYSSVITDDTTVFTITGPVSAVRAIFAKNLDINEVATSEYVIYSENNNIVVRGAEQQTIRVFDVVGRLVEQRSNANAEETISMSNTGIFLVKVGDAPAQRVVVRR